MAKRKKTLKAVRKTVRKIPRDKRVDLHKDGSIRAKGTMRAGKLDGYWRWFRKDGTPLRSGHFDKGRQVGEWTTYDANGAVYKVTVFT